MATSKTWHSQSCPADKQLDRGRGEPFGDRSRLGDRARIGTNRTRGGNTAQGIGASAIRLGVSPVDEGRIEAARSAARCGRGSHRQVWTAEQEKLLGQLPDEELARRLGRTVNSV